MILVLCPTRGRPAAVREVVESLAATRHDTHTRVLFVLDEGDPLRGSYQSEVQLSDPHNELAGLLSVPGGTMVKALNEAAAEVIQVDPFASIIGFIGDDHRFRTKGWDEIFLRHVQTHNVAMMYAHDGARSDIPTQIFVTSNVIHALGWFAPPFLKHLYVDDAWRRIGDDAGILYLFKDVLVEHMHPAWGKAASDEGYERVNSREMYSADGEAFHQWLNSGAYKETLSRILSMTYRPSGV